MKTNDPDVEAWRALLLTHSRVVRAIESDLRQAGKVSLGWYDVLLELNAAPGRALRMSDLGERAVLSRTRVSRIVDELENAGLVSRQADPNDGRASVATMTDAGRGAFRSAWPTYRASIRRQFGTHLDETQRRQIADLLGRVIAAHPPKPER